LVYNNSLLNFSLQCTSPPSSLLNLILDCERFVIGFFEVIEESAMHIYNSALPWSPTSSLTRKLYQMQMTAEVNLVNAIDAHWDSCIRTIPIAKSSIRIKFSHNSSALAVVSDEDVTIFETVMGMATFEVGEPATSIAFSSDDDMLVCGHDNGSVRVWDMQTSKLVQSFEGHGRQIFSIAFSPCGNMIVSGSGDETVRIWDISLGYCKSVLTGHSNRVFAVCWSGTGDRVISGSEDATMRVWDVSRQTCLMILRGHTNGVRCVASSCDSSLIASGSWDGLVKVYDARTGEVLQTISTNSWIDSVGFSTHGDRILYTNLSTGSIWDLRECRRFIVADFALHSHRTGLVLRRDLTDL
jgi:WD40 repeat protein